MALLIAGLLALIISADAGSIIGLSETQTGQLVPMVLILILVAGGAFGRRQKISEIFSNALAWVAIFGIAIVGYTYRDNLTNVADSVFGELVPGRTVIASEGGTVSVRRTIGGSFHLRGDINGASTRLIFDTGASTVVLTQDDARRAGIVLSSLRYSIPVQTANGTGRAAMVRLTEISIGTIVRRNVSAFIVQENALETSLLGMSFLETLSGYSVTGSTLELKD